MTPYYTKYAEAVKAFEEFESKMHYEEALYDLTYPELDN